MYPNTFYRVSVKALIKDAKGDVLVLKENQDTWSLPGGGLDHGEKPDLGIKRELKEELGIDMIKVGDIRRTLTFELKSKQAWLMWVVYDITIDETQDFTLGEGVVAAQFIDPNLLQSSKDIFEQHVYEIAKSS